MRSLVTLALFGALVAVPALGDITVAGDYNGWDPNANPMVDNGDGTYSLTLTGLDANSRQEFKIVDNGDWWPYSGNSWAYANESGELSVTYDLNVYEDGWVNTTRRINVDTDPGAWTAVGSFQGWDNANPDTAMDPMGGGIYYYEGFVPNDTEGVVTEYWKAVNTGSWDAIGTDARSINADNMGFDVPVGGQLYGFWVDAYTGVIQLEVIPEPASLLGLGLLGLLIRRR